MFFSNGGATGGAPTWLLLGLVYIGLILEGKIRTVMLLISIVMTSICWLVGYFFPQLVTEYSRGGNYFDSLVALIIVGAIEYTLIAFHLRLNRREQENKNLRRLFEQTATALVNAIDAKDEYTHGHSSRVAAYSKNIAKLSGKSPEECEEIYYAALLHDVGKIGVSESIINKAGRLTDEEYEEIKKHPVFGAQILHSISEYPNLIIGAAHYHHERYDGKGYPERLKGEDIPEIARIIAVADAYDAMTSKRSYRETIPQQKAREEIVKGSGTQFDPKFAKVMQHLIDMDTEYEMKEKDNVQELSGGNELSCSVVGDEISDGILLGANIRQIRMRCGALEGTRADFRPVMVLFDSLDGRYHDQPKDVADLNYFEYARLMFSGESELTGARKIEVKEEKSSGVMDRSGKKGRKFYEIEGVRVKDHVMITVDDGSKTTIFTVALPDNTRYAYIGLSGENCHFYNVSITTSEETVSEGFIPRIAEEVSYIDGPEGDVPNIQVDSYRTASTEGIPVRDGMKISFHAKSLPTARLVWHCAYVDMFYSSSKMPSGDDYQEYALIRLDGENWDTEGIARNKVIVNIVDDFEGWDAWKENNKKGYDCTVSFKIDGDKIITTTENFGISLKNITTVLQAPPEMYVCLTGDQVAITNIKIINPES
ncbi:MAG: HD-GYP domain-containing protein [Lachnospiraceae bacterium]|nr:HD-GYP domain-containing protein [Lachnospiraceae bacterium]